MSGAARFPDLMPRVASAVAMLAVGLGALWLGGWGLRLTLALVGAGIAWEVLR
ncbi:phosphatidate cytidylyltransferase, partial [Rhodobaculum claviforme]|nr:phosphatidate cytidylyltransferase [Rhodobaculum claviforme]